tara:strand:+ start:3538 stop:4827 length:1290 start_codon:yes stop_codon:yes gene_type:complete
MNNKSNQMYEWIKDLFPICRSITGNGLRDTLKYINKLLPELKIYEVPSGTKVFDWIIPDEWIIRDAFIKDGSGKKIIDFKKNNLHLMGYSESIDQSMSLKELDKFLYSLPDQPSAIPYVTSYYEKRWGFCISHNERLNLKEDSYHVYIDSEKKTGVMNYGELIIPGKSTKEIFLSTYVCHPSMANNELSGPVVTTALAQWLYSLKDLEYSYRIIFIPETIGSITYLSRNLEEMKENIIAGFNITCVGDNRSYSYLPSRLGNTLSDNIAMHVLKWIDPNFVKYNWLDRGSDERQYCAPGIDLPVASILRTKYGEYPEYHTSLDSLETVVTYEGLEGGYIANKKAIEAIEKNKIFKSTILCEPQMSKRGLYPTLSTKDKNEEINLMMNFISLCDGDTTLLDISEKLNLPIWSLYDLADKLEKNHLITSINN